MERRTAFILPKQAALPAVLNISPLQKILLTTISTQQEMSLLCYMAKTGNTQFANGKMIFLSGSPESGKGRGHTHRQIERHRQPSYPKIFTLQSIAII